LKLPIVKLTGLVMIGFVWIRIWAGGGSDHHINDPSEFSKFREFLSDLGTVMFSGSVLFCRVNLCCAINSSRHMIRWIRIAVFRTVCVLKTILLLQRIYLEVKMLEAAPSLQMRLSMFIKTLVQGVTSLRRWCSFFCLVHWQLWWVSF